MARDQALVTGATGVAGAAFVDELVEHGWNVVAVSRSEQPARSGVTWIQADLEDRASFASALAPHCISHVFHGAQIPPPAPITGSPPLLRLATTAGGVALRVTRRLAWAQTRLYRQLAISTGMYDPTQRNLQMLRNTIDLTQRPPHRLQHLVLVTGGRHYGMHLGPTLYPGYQSHYVEEQTPRCPEPNWYYDLEDHLRAATAGNCADWTWTVLRPSFLLGVVRNGRHNLGTAIGAYVALTAALGLPLDFLGDRRSASIRTDITSARQLAQAARWSVDSRTASNQAFNVAGGLPFTWADVWPAFVNSLARDGAVTPRGVRLTKFAHDHDARWRELARDHELVESDLETLASPGYADQMMLLDWEATFDTTKLRDAGFAYFPTPEQVLGELVGVMQDQKLIPIQHYFSAEQER